MTKHPILPALSEEEYAALKADIAAHGVLSPIELDEAGNILDGHHRVRICREVGIKDFPSIIRTGLSEQEKIEHMLAVNLARRQMTKAQRQDVVLTLRRQQWSSPRIAAALGVSDQTVLNDLKDATSKNLEVLLPERMIGKDGKHRPAIRPAIVVKTAKEAARAHEALERCDLSLLPNKLLEVKRVQTLARAHEARKLSHEVHDDTVHLAQATVLLGDIRKRGGIVTDASVDLVYTDPPYTKDAMPIWSDLLSFAARVLKPQGMLMAYTGKMCLPEAIERLSEHLRY